MAHRHHAATAYGNARKLVRTAPTLPVLDVSEWAQPSGSLTDALIAHIEHTRPDLATYRERFAEALRLQTRWHVVCRARNQGK